MRSPLGDSAEDGPGRVLGIGEAAVGALARVQVVEAVRRRTWCAVSRRSPGGDDARGERDRDERGDRQHEPDLPAHQHRRSMLPSGSPPPPACAVDILLRARADGGRVRAGPRSRGASRAAGRPGTSVQSAPSRAESVDSTADEQRSTGDRGGELEFFGVKLKVNNPRLAALLNSDVTEDVQVIGRRARDVFAGAADDRAECGVAERVQHARRLRLHPPGRGRGRLTRRAGVPRPSRPSPRPRRCILVSRMDGPPLTRHPRVQRGGQPRAARRRDRRGAGRVRQPLRDRLRRRRLHRRLVRRHEGARRSS